VLGSAAAWDLGGVGRVGQAGLAVHGKVASGKARVRGFGDFLWRGTRVGLMLVLLNKFYVLYFFKVKLNKI
jgi:hypothetical protein